ncbi:MAG: type I 3-dehydroquinate dehydratase, partial [Vicinamibacterales bacterium]
MSALVAARDAVRGADLVEVRLDGATDPSPEAAIGGRATPIVVTCRPTWEGGRFDGDETTREALLERALQAGADFVDVEWAAAFRPAFVNRWAERVIVSSHDFHGTPPNLADRVRAMRGSGAAIVKVAVTATRLRDLAVLLALSQGLPRDGKTVVIGMGAAGALTRILPQRFGSCWTYAGQGVAPGQITTDRLLREFRIRQITAATAVFGVVGRPVAHSISPAMHNAALAALGLDAVYLPFEAVDFQDFLWAADTFDLVGASVTAPFKTDALAQAATADERATSLGAANTLRRTPDGGWSVRNTDVDGFLAPLTGTPLLGRRVAVLGAGGSARAVVAGLLSRQAAVTVYARRSEAAEALARHFGVQSAEWPPPPGTWDLLVNTTPVGTWPRVESAPVEASIVQGPLVYDLVYNPPDTALLQAARTHGAETFGGLDMLVGQAAEQFTWWTGHPAPGAGLRVAATVRLEAFRAEADRT